MLNVNAFYYGFGEMLFRTAKKVLISKPIKLDPHCGLRRKVQKTDEPHTVAYVSQSRNFAKSDLIEISKKKKKKTEQLFKICREM